MNECKPNVFILPDGSNDGWDETVGYDDGIEEGAQEVAGQAHQLEDLGGPGQGPAALPAQVHPQRLGDGIGMLEQRKPEKEVTQNAPGVIFTLAERGQPGPPF